MAAGLVLHTVTLTTGETREVYFWAADTAAPNVDLTPAKILVDASGNAVTFNANGQTTKSASSPTTLASDDNAVVALELIDDAIKADDAAFTPGTTKVMVAGFQADETATDSVDEGDAGAARMTLDRKQHVVTELVSSSMRDLGGAVTPKFAIIDAASSGDNTLLAAVASKKIRVLSAFLVAAGAVTVRFESGAGGTALTGQMNVAANGGFALPFNPVGWFQTATNTLLNLELSGATSVDGCLTYIEVD